ncbi:hypothetical protein DL766_007160 [Monosporascus sp. MC13-8B]|nr:hypothetical protein DL763_000940 [Monosporascus cannonballus]RYP25067.1 hypothetical protein DL766_007160 [Monosporascus sp. MC13-8B]
MLVAFAAFNVALWQHLSSAISASMTGVLAFEAVVCRTGPEAIALAWVSFVLAVGSVISLAIEKQRHLSSAWSLGTLSRDSVPTDNTNAEEDAGANIDTAERPPQPAWHQPQMLPNLAWLLYLTGQGDPERTVRQRNTAMWVDPNDRMHPGYAETIVEEARMHV